MNFNPKSLFSSVQFTFVIVAIIAASLIWSTVKAVQKNYELQAQVDQLEEEIAILELENENLQLGISYYDTDAYLELEARKKFNKASSGENVLLLPKDGDGAVEDAPIEESQAQEEELSNFAQWKYFLFGRHDD